MDEFGLLQEAVANWESLDGVQDIETREIYNDLGERTFLSKIQVRGTASPMYVETHLVYEISRVAHSFDIGREVIWRMPK